MFSVKIFGGTKVSPFQRDYTVKAKNSDEAREWGYKQSRESCILDAVVTVKQKEDDLVESSGPAVSATP